MEGEIVEEGKARLLAFDSPASSGMAVQRGRQKKRRSPSTPTCVRRGLAFS